MSRTVQINSRFFAAIPHLEFLQAQIIEELKHRHKSRLPQKLQIEDAIQCLRLCETHAITASVKVIQLRPTRTRPPSEYRIVEDHESDDCSFWTELRIGTENIRPLPGTLFLTACGRTPADPDGNETDGTGRIK